MSTKKRLILIWLITSEVLLAFSLVFWILGFILAVAELAIPLWILIGSYPIFVFVSAWMAWRSYAKAMLRNSFLWSLFPIIWYGLIYGMSILF
ncbi:hypothetical protein [Ectobacillus polymachus]|uniref:hypothetical protein n=1 Tax=Ectobacillus polymachus TaxID=1508806 RepID=UPI003A88F2DA